MAERQLVLTLPHRAASGREDFLISHCNRYAVEWVDRWPGWPFPGLVICGPAGSGKTHLGAVWRARSDGLDLNAADISAHIETVIADETIDQCFLDDAENADQEALFHLFNCLEARRGSLLITARTPPAQWPTGLPDLISRLKTLPVAEITLPDDDMLRAVLVKQFADRQVKVSPDVVGYLIARMDRNFDTARRIVATLDEAALARKRAITIPLVRDVFTEWG